MQAKSSILSILFRSMAVLSIALSCLILTSCAPRGENQSVDEVLKTQRSNFNSQVSNAGVAEPMLGQLKSLAGALDHLQGDGDGKGLASTADGISTTLSGLILKAGFTSRPALTELLNQYRALSAAPQGMNNSAVKLLVARTYSTLASELETTKFSL